MWLKTILMVAALCPFAAPSAFSQTGTVVAWGYNGSGQTTIPAGLSGVVAIAAGVAHSSKTYLHFEDFNKKLDVGVGFWVDVPGTLP